jgi:serine/threonine-protein kinase
VLGAGTFGVVYQARLLGEGRFVKNVAIKVLNLTFASDAEVVARLRDEARMLAMLRHRAIVGVDALTVLDGRWAIVMEHIEGADLRQLIDHGRVPVSAALEACEEVAAALHAAHDARVNGAPLHVLHRDIKPGNIRLTPRGEVKILDFGIARAEFEGREAETKERAFGSRGYMSPERLDFVDLPAGDVYALGVVLAEAVIGRALPPTAVQLDRHEAWLARIHTRLQETGCDPEIPALLAEVLVHDPARRPTPRQLVDRLRSIRQRLAGPSLLAWSEEALPLLPTPDAVADPNGLVGTVLDEQAVPSPAPLSRDPMPPTVFLKRVAPAGGDGLLVDPVLAAPTRIARDIAVVPTVLHPRAAREPAVEPPRPDARGTRTGWMMTGAAALGIVPLIGFLLAAFLAAVLTAWWLWPSPAPPAEGPSLGDVLFDLDEAEPAAEAVAAAPPPVVEIAASAPPAPPARAAEHTVASASAPCGDRMALEGRAVLGQLSASEVACLTGIAESDARQTDRAAVSRVLLVHEAARAAEGACAAYDARMRYHLENIEQSDPSVLYAWTRHLYRRHGVAGATEAIGWAGRTLAAKGGWDPAVFADRTSKTHEIRTQAAYRVWEAANLAWLAERTEPQSAAEEAARHAVRLYAVEWIDFDAALGRDTTAAQALCASAVGDPATCRGGNSATLDLREKKRGR